ncbi:chorismate mutase [Pseudonocardia endophytica]|uniref:chorismate mutase n=1 Tax=Pseudonocardia endophytica TaxID=401976 RepID=A0A4R1HMQ1_PSEEN|nr:chorismate mutase [Pseudonocardia endophytica]TCK21610.1 chorismate mutase [Pseudonocardia endophytica]
MIRCRSVAGAVLLLALLAGCSGTPPLSQGPLPEDGGQGLDRIVALAARRVVVSDQVAAAKVGTGQPVTDPPREAAVIAAARTEAEKDRVDPEWAARVFTDQIAASTQVQNDLLRQWTDRPDTKPAQRPALATIRPELDRIGTELVAAMAQAAPARSHEACAGRLAQAAVDAAKPLDDVHRSALGLSLTSVCASSG